LIRRLTSSSAAPPGRHHQTINARSARAGPLQRMLGMPPVARCTVSPWPVRQRCLFSEVVPFSVALPSTYIHGFPLNRIFLGRNSVLSDRLPNGTTAVIFSVFSSKITFVICTRSNTMRSALTS